MIMTVSNSLEDYYAAKEKEVAASVDNMLRACDSEKIDVSVIAEPVLKTKRLNIGGSEFKANIHTNEDALRVFSLCHREHFVSLVQFFTEFGSIIMPFTKENLIGQNWANETQIAHNDILNRTVAALGFAEEQVILQIAKHIAYETDSNEKQHYDGIDGQALHRVWH